MKKHITVAALLAAGCMFANADVISLDPVGEGTTGENSAGILPSDVWGYAPNAWHGTWENEWLANQVGFSAENGISMQLGAASEGVGNFAAVKFAVDATGEATLTFDYEYASTWGGAKDLVVDYVCTVYGFTEDGTSVKLASETFIDGVTVSAVTEGETGNLSLSFATDASYAAYGVIFNADEAGGNNGGVAVSIDNVQVSYSAIPEPSAFGLLAGLGALALVASRRRRK